MEQVDPIFLELGIITAVAAIFGVMAKAFRQPPILGYILAGIILGPIGVSLIQNQDNLVALSQFGIALLLFLVGLEMDWQKIKSLSFITGILSLVQIIITFALGFITAYFFDFNFSQAFILGLALSFSSTIVAVKLLSEKHDLESLYGRIAIGVLIVQDLVAIFAIALLSGFSQSANLPIFDILLSLIARTIFLCALAWIFASIILPAIFKQIAKSSELLFIVSLAWCFLFAIFTVKFGFSLEIGAFLAGLSLASLPYSLDIVSRIRSLRDFFIILFFVILGTEINIADFTYWKLIIVFTILAVLVKPLIVIASLGWQGLRRRTAFLSGLALGQMSEFSLILAGLSLELNLIDQKAASIITLSSALSLLFSPYLVNSSEKIFSLLRPYLVIFEKRRGSKYSLELESENVSDDLVIIFGYHRLGYHILKTLKNLGHDILVIDFNPQVIDLLQAQKIPAIFGDAQDEELLESLHIQKAKMLISTIPHREETLFLIHKLQQLKKQPLCLVTAKSVEEALEYYKNGADYVILPEQISGEHMTELLRKYENKTLHQFLKSKSEEVRLLKTKNHALYLE